MLPDGRIVAAVLSTANIFWNLLFAPQSMGATLQDVSALIQRAESKDRFNLIAYEPLSEKIDTGGFVSLYAADQPVLKILYASRLR